MSNYVYSSSPQIKSRRTSRWIMIDVCIALLPSCIAGCILLGWGALLQLVIAVLSAVAAEWVYLLCCKKSFKQIFDQFDFSSVVTGLLVGMNVYANSAWYATMLASVFAIIVVKMLFGGTGKNIVNPAIAGRIFAFISFGAAFGGTMHFVNEAGNASQVFSPVTGGYIQGATPLQAMFGNIQVADAYHNTLTYADLFLGTGVPGTIGEVCKLALVIGGIYLIVRGVLNFRWPLVYMLTTGVVAVIIAWAEQGVMVNAGDVFYKSIFSGGLMLGAIFMATDFVTTPNTKLGNYIYFVLLGVLTAVLRWAVKGEAVSFAILLMNLFVPLIDKYIVRRPFGYVKPPKKQKEAK
ncbi:MAG: RnfABCDGE type electron transport complex subunit D [Corallococcus sp.]|nr:RnfABCDGE type electron transport complex subunit D [Corallococcus sp.]MCM1359882.1 RnfABCDGE type electron transport complex subunit D [Corallococcus sp.]MCM1395316.1 RnfABCDGE type electron transport complex subunit D [Corallococcus sp.]